MWPKEDRLWGQRLESVRLQEHSCAHLSVPQPHILCPFKMPNEFQSRTGRGRGFRYEVRRGGDVGEAARSCHRAAKRELPFL